MTFGQPDGPSVSILIVNYRSTELLMQCLQAVRGQTAFEATETIVVDNGSPGFDASEVTAAHPWVRVVVSAVNLTYTGGNNRAYEHAAGELILLLNPDTVLEPSAVETAISHFEVRPEVVAQGALLLNEDGTLQRYYRRLPRALDAPYLLLGPLFARLPGGRRYLMLEVPFGPETPVDQPPGAFLMVRRAGIGHDLLDAGYFNYMSDVELCARLRRTGPIVVFDDVRCLHAKGGAGIATQDPHDQLRLRHDLTWGVRRYFAGHSWPARLYVECWLVIFWAIRLIQLALRQPARLGLGLTAAIRALRGDPPVYD